MSLMSGLQASISGLNAYGSRVSIEADNISKTDAVGGKSKEVFVLSGASSTSVQGYTPGGVTTSVQQYITTVGELKPSEVSTFMAIRDQGFFPVSSSATEGTGKIGWTRNGTFAPDKNGNFANTSGQFLMAWPTNDTGTVTSTDQSTTAGLSILSVGGLNGAPASTVNVNMKAVLPGAAVAGPTTFGVPVQVIDTLGVSHQVTFTYTKTVNAPQTWNVVATCPDAAAIAAPYQAGMNIVFDNNGNPATFNGNIAPPPVLNLTWNNAAAASNVTIDMGAIGASDGLRAVGGAFNPSQVTSDGRTSGNYESVSIDQSTGLVMARYDNGAIVPFAKVPLGTFADANQLLETSGGVYQATADSGNYMLNAVGANGAGTIVTSNIEGSTIDSTEQLTMMIVDKANYESNAKAISITSELIQASNQMIR